jgi:hypothetical protein
MISARKHPQEALGLAMTAAAALERAIRAPSPEQLSVYGALHLAAATAAAACYDRGTTEMVLAKARGIAARTGEANHMGTGFGPVNVAIHAISASLRLGDPRTATKTGEALDTAAMPGGLIGRRTQVNLDLARAYAMCRKDAAAVNLLLAAERLIPSWSATTRRLGTSSPNCCAANIGPRHRNCARWHIARACSYPHFRAGSPPAPASSSFTFTPLQRLFACPS